jgi:short-subunit dehydrogenase
MKNKEWALVTGASSGIGKDFCLELAKRNFNLIQVARSNDLLNQNAKALKEKYGTESFIICEDLSSREKVEIVLEKTKNFDISIIVLAAGFGTSGDFIDIPIQDELNMIDLNCIAVVQICSEFVNRFKSRGEGKIVLFSSLVAFQGVARAATYSATKAFIQSFAEGIYTELKKINIDVISCAPGPIHSGFGSRAKMNMGLSAKPNGIANETLNAIGKSLTVRPGLLSKILGYSLAPLPRFFRRMILNKIMGDMTRDVK